MRNERGANMKRKRHILAFFLAVCMICTNLSVQAASVLDLYAVWKVRVTLDAGEGVFTGGATEEEKVLAASGVSTGSFEVNTQSRYSTGLSAKRDGYGFVEWNTKPDGSGTELSEYGLITGPVTFYAVYYQTDFPCIQDVQVFKAPQTATYRVQCWGASGGMDQRSVGNVYGGSGGYCAGLLALNEGDVLYVYTGGAGGDETGVGNPVMWGGYNGGGSGPLSGGSSGGGGGATDVRLVGGSWDNPEGLASRLIVAAGGGGGGSTSAAYSGDAGGLTGSTSRGNNGTIIVAGATQTAAGPLGGFGYGGSSPYAGGGGGGGYYGGGATAQTDMSGSGGSSYISGYTGCEARDDYVLTDTVMIAGSGANMPSWSGGVLSNGVRGDGYCRIVQYNG